jgi:hypothetical protein
VDITADVRPASWLRATGSYSHLRIQVTRDPQSRDVSQERRYEGLSPRQQLRLHASVDLPASVMVDWLWRRVSALPAGPVPGHATSDVRVGWQPHPSVELFVVGKNLHQPRHVEWTGSVRIERAAFAGVTFRR